MPSLRNRNQRGFSLIELSIVLGVIGVIIAGIWGYVTSGRQHAKLEQSTEAITLTTDAVRSVYASAFSISNGITTVMPFLDSSNALPAFLMRATTSACSGVTAHYADNPFSTGGDTCGSFRVCAWSYGVTSSCTAGAAGPPASSQVFAIEFADLDYGSCLMLTEHVTPTIASGMLDVYVNAISSMNSAGHAIPMSSSLAGTTCTTTVPPANTVDFVFKLRAPTT